MTNLTLLTCLLTCVGAWGGTRWEFRESSFCLEPRAERVWRSAVSDLLFDRPTVMDGTLFSNSDASANDLALAGLLKADAIETGRTGSEFRSSLSYLVSLEEESATAFTQVRTRHAIHVVNRISFAVDGREPRQEYLCREIKLLLAGFSAPVASAYGLKDLSDQSLAISPTIAQVALVHAINLFRRAGRKETADHLFAAGMIEFSANNPTEYVWRYWHPILESVDEIREQTSGKITTTTIRRYVPPHGPWMF